ncbi:dynein regulatory complex protein 9-like [Armigeres subalbatus]|uniref:dynein regulatory complex protein 9-like n=1 Tax=Armigeres subalbatus TaxID=124917 RepID=UPI002ED0E542
MDDLEKRIVSKLFHSAWFKLQILNAVPSSTDQLLDGTGSYSIGQLLEQKIAYLEAINCCLLSHDDESLPASSSELMQTSAESGDSLDTFDLKRYERCCKEERFLRRQWYTLFRLHDLTNQDHAEEYSLEVARNILVERWEFSRMEQLLFQLQDRYDTLEKDTRNAERYIRLNLKACRLIEQFYAWQLDKVEMDIDQWMERFEREKDDLDGRFQRARAKRKLWDTLKEEVQHREGEVERLQLLENAHNKRIDYKKLCWDSAIKIQAWWRGVIVRKGIKLGRRRGKPRRKAKSKGKKSNSKKGNKSTASRKLKK